MHRIIIQISEGAQRSAILAGGNAAREQTFEIQAGPEDGPARARLLALPRAWTEINEKGQAKVAVPARAKVAPGHFAGAAWQEQDWRSFGNSYLDEAIDLRAAFAPASAAEALDYAESVASLAWLDAARAERAERLARDKAEAAEREERERPEREARAAREAERAEREREERAKAEAEEAQRRDQIGALFGPPEHPERIRFEAGAMSQNEIENAVETRLTAWLPQADPETGAFSILSVESHRYQVSTMRPGQGRTVAKIVTPQEAFAFFRKLEDTATKWVAKAPGRRSAELWRAKCDCGQAVADVVIRDGALEWDGWVALGEPGPDGHPAVEDD